mmetsp:Transcript_15948/g.24681  ORF Transcript_15948/g.24681 Transcript_15948/m.24681 type:complete len:139 (-) Transcript_15948:78-494(-)
MVEDVQDDDGTGDSWVRGTMRPQEMPERKAPIREKKPMREEDNSFITRSAAPRKPVEEKKEGGFMRAPRTQPDEGSNTFSRGNFARRDEKKDDKKEERKTGPGGGFQRGPPRGGRGGSSGGESGAGFGFRNSRGAAKK